VYGASDRHGGHVRDNPVSPEDFGATLFAALGVPPQTRLGADGFTHPASAGRPVEALFG
jgi:arylsulfatase A-like enzyme